MKPNHGLQKTARRPNKSTANNKYINVKQTIKKLELTLIALQGIPNRLNQAREVYGSLSTQGNPPSQDLQPTRIKIIQNIWNKFKRFLRTVLPNIIWHTGRRPNKKTTKDMGQRTNRHKPVPTPHTNKIKPLTQIHAQNYNSTYM